MTNWILVPVRNGIHYTVPAVDSFLKQDIGNVRVLLIDNASEDGTADWAQREPGVVHVRNGEPKGVAASWNQGLCHIFDVEGCLYALVVNNDVLLRPDTYRYLLTDGGGFVTAVGAIEAQRIAPPYFPPDPTKKRPHPDFSCYLIRRWAYEKIGLFDEDFQGAYTEDCSYHVRMHRKGIKAESLELPFLHYASGTIKSANTGDAAAISQRAHANRQLFRQKFGCEVGSEEYYALFDNATFGADA